MSGRSMRRVAVTGIGLVTPLGHSPREIFESARAGQSAIRPFVWEATARLRSPLAATVMRRLRWVCSKVRRGGRAIAAGATCRSTRRRCLVMTGRPASTPLQGASAAGA